MSPPFLVRETLQMLTMERRKIGRPSRGDRRQVKVLMPRKLADALMAEAQRRGTTMTDFIGETVAQEIGLPYMEQEALPTSTAS